MFIPGRIEILGKHTDYCGGRSIVCAIDRGFRAEIDERADGKLVLDNLDTREKVSIDLAQPVAAVGHWSNYAAEAARRLTANFGALNGVSIRFRSDLPKAAGLSSSSALMIMIFAALNAVNHLRSRDEFRENITDEFQLAEYLGCVENGQTYHGLQGSTGVGTFGGSQDHAAIILGKADRLTAFSFSPLRHDADFVFPQTHGFVVASSGVSAEKTGAAKDRYNRLSAMVKDVVSASERKMTLAEMIEEIGIEDVRRHIHDTRSVFTTQEMLDRVEQFYIENFEITPTACDALADGKIDQLGDIIDRSQKNAERFLSNQINETIFLQRSAREIGAVAASAFGAGFGGSVYAIVRNNDADEFREEWQRLYTDRHPHNSDACEFFVTRPSNIVLA